MQGLPVVQVGEELHLAFDGGDLLRRGGLGASETEKRHFWVCFFGCGLGSLAVFWFLSFRRVESGGVVESDDDDDVGFKAGREASKTLAWGGFLTGGEKSRSHV